ncbi:hypothetical protein FRX31_003025 [Thalictrum thalictroides]|uniref:Uncharacterized protein n=1 Tax=Thalictrum thalictroides TaxID=46969 RepID=A0A7J6XCP6_THATH|nr:hypothetical protein FRX31_003025 [Thalictrum thalictroides]
MAQASLATTVYWLWYERNKIMYGDSTANVSPLFKMIINDVKLRFAGLQHCFKNTTTNIEAVHPWKTRLN